MKKKRAEQVLQTTFSLIWFGLPMPNFSINRNEKKRAKQVLQTMFSLIWFVLHMPTCNINRNEKKTCRAGIADNVLIDLVCTSINRNEKKTCRAGPIRFFFIPIDIT